MTLGLTSRIVLSFVLFAGALLTLAGVLSYRSGSASLETAVATEVLSLAVEKEAALAAAIDERLDDVERISASADLVERVQALTTAARASRKMRALILQELAPNTSGARATFVEMSVIEPHGGIVLASTTPSQEGRSKIRRPYFANGNIGLHLQVPYYSANLKAPAMVISAPVRSPAGATLAVVAARLSLTALTAIAERRSGQYSTEDTFLFNSSRQFVTQPRFLTEPAVLRRTLDGDLVPRCMSAGNAEMRKLDYRGTPVIAACRWDARHQLGLIVKIDQAEAFLPVRAFARSMTAIGGLALVASLGVALLLARRIVRPVHALHANVKRFAEGQFKEPIPGLAHDELGLLAHEFNAMALTIGAKEDDLRRLAGELEDRVHQATAELARAQEVAQLGSWESDLVHGATTWSDQAFAIFGLDKHTCTPSYERYLSAVHPDDRQRSVAWTNSIVERKAPDTLELRIVRPDGAVRDIHGRADVVLDDTGHVVGLVGTIQDVTARKKSEEQFQHLLEAAPEAMVIVDHDGRIVLVNEQTEHLFGYARAALLGQSIEILVPARFSGHAAHRKAFAANGATRRMGTQRQLAGLRSDGTEVPVEISLSPIETEQGTLVISAIRDVTENRQAEAALQQAKAEAEAANRAKSEFLATMSHEIRTPMNGVVGAVGLLLDGELTPRQHELASIARSSAQSLLAIINDILDISKIEAGKMQIEQATFDLQQMLEDVGEMFATRAAEKQLELVLSYASGARRRFVGDAGRIRQVLVNLVGNAIKFCEHGHVFIHIEEDPGEDPRTTLRVTVEDTGMGIPPEAVNRLFERFSQADASTTRRFGGTGLGLAICRRLVELMNGQIGVTSTAGSGSTFWFTLPLLVDASAEPTATSTPADITAARVLLVDGNPVQRLVMLDQMHAWHLRADTAPSGAEALAALRAAHDGGNPYHLALIDYHLPDMDGVALAKAITADPAVRYTKLILLTSALDEHPDALGREGGFAKWLTKPVRPSSLFDAIISACAGQPAGPGARVTAPGAASTASSGRRRFSGRVLVADDNRTNQRVAQLALEGLGCRVDIARNGLDALAALQQQPFDLVFMDCEMPEMDGFEATSEIRAREARGGSAARRTPVVAMTAKALSGDRKKCLAAGMDDYLAKPVQLEALVDMLTRWLPAKAAPAPQRRTGDRRTKERRTHARPAAPSGALDAAAIDRLRDLAQATTPTLFAQVLEAYQADAAKYIAALQDAAAHGDGATLRRTGHALKGASLNVGATALADMSLRLETVDEPGGLTLAAVPSLLARLAKELTRVQTEIDRELAQERAA